MNAKNWDIFCKVIDNYGDIGVCYRLARQLSREHGLYVRLWVDELASLAPLAPGTDIHASVQVLNGIEVRHWTPLSTQEVPAADVVLEAFACDIPDGYLQAMTARRIPPLWINLEYLSAEEWIESCHRLTSIHPQSGLIKHFFFPGFTARTGGLLKEANLDIQRTLFTQSTAAQPAFWQSCKVPPPRPDEWVISLFAYDNPAIPLLLKTWSEESQPVYCALPIGKALINAQTWANQPLQASQVIERGALRLAILPFLPQNRYDHLLWSCDLNFVRGEDSFVRAQWAAKPFVWHIYPQDEHTHLAKLEAFLQHYVRHLDTPAAEALTAFWLAWNSAGIVDHLPACWHDLLSSLPDIQRHSHRWTQQITQARDLAANLVQFCTAVVEL